MPATQRRPPTRRRQQGPGRPPCASSSGASACSSRSSCCSSGWRPCAPPGSARSGPARCPSARSSQQVEDLDVPARRGTIIDRNGVELAVSEDSVTVFANPFLIKDPREGGGHARAARSSSPRTSCCAELSDREKGFVYLQPQDRPHPRREDREAGDRGHRHASPSRGAPTRRARSPRRCWASWAPTTTACPGSSTRSTRRCSGEDGERRLVKDALGEPISIDRDRALRAGRGPRAHARRRASRSAPRRCSADVGQTYTPMGATAVVMDPRNGQVLALANWPRVDANNVGGAPEYARQNRAVAGQLRAGLDVQGLHRLRRARGEARSSPAPRSRSRPRSPGGRPRPSGEAHERGGGDA